MWHRITKWTRRIGNCFSERLRPTKTPQPASLPDITDQAAQTALALTAWHIEQGCAAVHRIDLPFLLRRIATSARQDGIRLEAALRLDQPALIARVARDAKDISLRWRAARYLDDPMMMADVALFKPTSKGFEAQRRLARATLLRHLDALQSNSETERLLAFLYAVAHTDFKLQAFLRLPAEAVEATVLHDMAAQDFRYASTALIEAMIIRIQSGGWRVRRTTQTDTCVHCCGKGEVMLGGMPGVRRPPALPGMPVIGKNLPPDGGVHPGSSRQQHCFPTSLC
jgi:hypothetical protein